MSIPSAEDLNVSRETLERLQIFVSLIEKWNPRINLVSKSSLSEIWERHVRDSLQVYKARPDDFDLWVDLGSGGGFPGLVIAILAAESHKRKKIMLVESDGRKVAFLRTVLRETGVAGEVICGRIEDIAPLGADVLSARALADLRTLLSFAHGHLSPTGVALFPKGAKWEKEVEEAKKEWSFFYETIESETEKGSVVLKVGEIVRV